MLRVGRMVKEATEPTRRGAFPGATSEHKKRLNQRQGPSPQCTPIGTLMRRPASQAVAECYDTSGNVRLPHPLRSLDGRALNDASRPKAARSGRVMASGAIALKAVVPHGLPTGLDWWRLGFDGTRRWYFRAT
jgi:hypothetical protein